jgi:hypothetical protein
MDRVTLRGDESLGDREAQRPATVKVKLSDGRQVEQHVPAVRGTADNPMAKHEIEAKEMDLLAGVLGNDKARATVDAIWGLDVTVPVASLRPLLQL